MENLSKILALGSLVIGGLAVAGCESNYDKLHKNKGVREVYATRKVSDNGLYRSVTHRDTYDGFAKQLKRDYPELKNVDIDDIISYLQKLNDHRVVKDGQKVRLPVY